MLRLSLWADKVIHKSLSSYDIIYFTIAYDWMLFGHDLYTRASQSVELLYFCFLMLPKLISKEYSLNSDKYEERSSRLQAIHDEFIQNWGEYIQKSQM